MASKHPVMIFVRQDTRGEEIVSQLDIQPNSRPIIFLIAGAKYAAEENKTAMENATAQIAAAAVRLNAIVIDGGTNAGPMGLLNDALAAQNFSGDYIGFLPAFSSNTPEDIDRSQLGNSHTHFVLVEGDRFGDEREPIFETIRFLGREGRAACVVVNGGLLAKEEVFNSVKFNLPLVVMLGSGRLADELARPDQAGKILTAKDVADLREIGRFTVVDGVHEPGKIAGELERILSY